MKKIAVLGALPMELETFWGSIQDRRTEHWGTIDLQLGCIGTKDVVSFATGIGKVRAAAGAQFTIDCYFPTALIFIGAAGSLNPKYKPGKIIVGQTIVEYDFDIYPLAAKENRYVEEFHPDSKLSQIALAACQKVVGDDQVLAGKILTGDQVIMEADKREQLRQLFGGDCAEMEAVAVAKVCAQNQVPYSIIRILSDSADQNTYVHFDAMLDVIKTDVDQILHEILRQDL